MGGCCRSTTQHKPSEEGRWRKGEGDGVERDIKEAPPGHLLATQRRIVCVHLLACLCK